MLGQWCDEHVADAAHRLDHAWFLRIVAKFPAENGNMHVDGAVERREPAPEHAGGVPLPLRERSLRQLLWIEDEAPPPGGT